MSQRPRRRSFPRLAAPGLLALGLLALATGCASTPAVPAGFQPADAARVAALRDLDLRLTRFLAGGKEVALQLAAPISLRFGDAGQLSGRSAVNRYFGGYELGAQGALRWPGGGVLGATRMAGPPEAMELESRYFQALTATSKLFVFSDGARFQTADASIVLEFTR